MYETAAYAVFLVAEAEGGRSCRKYLAVRGGVWNDMVTAFEGDVTEAELDCAAVGTSRLASVFSNAQEIIKGNEGKVSYGLLFWGGSRM